MSTEHLHRPRLIFHINISLDYNFQVCSNTAQYYCYMQYAEVGTSAPESAPPHLRSERNISFGAECKERNAKSGTC